MIKTIVSTDLFGRSSKRPRTYWSYGSHGLLMECVASWSREDGYSIEPYGLDFSPRVADLARQRLPRWAGRIYTGNVIDWQPPRHFDFVRMELDYVPVHRQRGLVGRLLSEVVAPGGRLIVCSYGSSSRPASRAEPVGAILRGWGYEVAGETEATAPNGVVVLRVAWLST